MRALLSCLVIIVKVSELQKLLSDTWKLFRPFLKAYTAHDKYSVTSRDKWMQTIQMNLSQKQKVFSEFFLHFSNLH